MSESPYFRCPFCLEQGFEDDIQFVPPRGHTIEYLDEARTIRIDSCPDSIRIRPVPEEDV